MFLYSAWTNLNINTRHEIAARFGIIKKHSTEVVENVIKNDGYTIKDVEEALNIDAIQEFLGVKVTDMAILWNLLVAKIEGREEVIDIKSPEDIDTLKQSMMPPLDNIIEEYLAKPKRGRPAKKKL